MAYTIKGLAKANDCEELNEFGLAQQWDYWLACNSNDRQSINDFKRLRIADREQMIGFLRSEPLFQELYNHIVSRILG